jgi:signal transduction histidine kinase
MQANEKPTHARTQGLGARLGISSLRSRILIWMAVLALAPLVIMAFQGYHCAKQALVESEEAHLLSAIEARKARLETWLAEVKADSRFLAAAHCAQKDCSGMIGCADPGTPDDACNFLADLKQRSTSYEALLTFDLNWKPLSQANNGSKHAESLPPDFKAALSASETLTIVPPFLRNGGVAAYIGRPVFDADGNRKSYTVAVLNVSQAVDPILCDRTGLGKSGKIFLISREGRYLSAPPGAAYSLGGQSNLPAEFFSGESAVIEYKDARGVRVLGVSAAVPELDGIVVAEIDRDEAFGWLATLRTRAVLTGAITLGIVLLVAVSSAAGLSRPLRELAEISRKVARGRHEERLGLLEGAEAQEVGAAFNQMLDELAVSQRRLVHAASLAAVGELSSRIVHEMRNPLSSVKINLQSLRTKVEGDPAYSELADIASNQVIRIERMLSDLLGYGKPLNLDLEETTFAAVAKDVIDTVRSNIEGKGVAVEIEDNIGETAIVMDAELIRQALTNLVANAVQAAPRGGRVIVSGAVEPDDPEQICISVADDGPGIADHIKDKLFQPFSTTRDEGTGLGLANVKKIVEYHGGQVSAENRPDGGALFAMLLPLGGSNNEQNPDN